MRHKPLKDNEIHDQTKDKYVKRLIKDVFAGASGIEQYDSYHMFANYSGFTNWAATNRIVVLFPWIDWGAAAATGQESSGCYDGYAQTGADYDVRSGLQMQVIKRMVDAAVGGKLAHADQP